MLDRPAVLTLRLVIGLHSIGSGREDRDCGHTAGGRGRRHVRDGEVGDRPGRDGPRAAAVRRRGRRAPLPGAPGAADALHLATGRAGDRRRLRSGEPPGRGAQRDRSACGPAGPGPRRLGIAQRARPGHRRERLGNPDAPAPRRGAAPHDRGAPAAGDRPPPRLLVGARAIRRLRRSGGARDGVPTRPAVGPARQHQQPRRRPAARAARTFARRSSRTCSTSTVPARVERPPFVGGCAPSSG